MTTAPRDHRVLTVKLDTASAFLEDEGAMESRLAAYMLGTELLLQGRAGHMSLATDKSRVRGTHLMNTCVVLPNNCGAWLVPQVAACLRKRELLGV